MQFHEYETIIIIRPDLDDADSKAIVERLEAVLADGAHVLDVEDWGNKRLAYPINKHQKGHYVLFSFLAPAALIAKLERVIRINDDVVRFLTVRRAEAVDVEVRVQEASEARKARLEQEAIRAEEEAKRAAAAAEYAANEASRQAAAEAAAAASTDDAEASV